VELLGRVSQGDENLQENTSSSSLIPGNALSRLRIGRTIDMKRILFSLFIIPTLAQASPLPINSSEFGSNPY